MTKRAGRSVSNDPGFQAILQAKADAICLVAKAWDYHVRVALGITNEENLEGVAQSVEGGREARRREAMIDCEHFFDGYKGNRAYALAVATHRLQGRRALGGAVRHQRRHAAARDRSASSPRWSKHVPGTHLGIHTHNDTENAVANYAGRRARRRAPDPGHAQRPGRALRQRQPHLDHPDAAAEERVRRPLRDAGDAGAACRSSPTPAACSTSS